MFLLGRLFAFAFKLSIISANRIVNNSQTIFRNIFHSCEYPLKCNMTHKQTLHANNKSNILHRRVVLRDGEYARLLTG